MRLEESHAFVPHVGGRLCECGIAANERFLHGQGPQGPCISSPRIVACRHGMAACPPPLGRTLPYPCLCYQPCLRCPRPQVADYLRLKLEQAGAEGNAADPLAVVCQVARMPWPQVLAQVAELPGAQTDLATLQDGENASSKEKEVSWGAALEPRAVYAAAAGMPYVCVGLSWSLGCRACRRLINLTACLPHPARGRTEHPFYTCLVFVCRCLSCMSRSGWRPTNWPTHVGYLVLVIFCMAALAPVRAEQPGHAEQPGSYAAGECRLSRTVPAPAPTLRLCPLHRHAPAGRAPQEPLPLYRSPFKHSHLFSPEGEYHQDRVASLAIPTQPEDVRRVAVSRGACSGVGCVATNYGGVAAPLRGRWPAVRVLHRHARTCQVGRRVSDKGHSLHACPGPAVREQPPMTGPAAVLSTHAA